jgi:hypothetical protein
MHRGARQRRRLHAEDPRCFYCGVITALDPPSGWPRRKPFLQLATIEHLRPRTHPSRLEPARSPNERRHVLACWQCNMDRANEAPVEVRRALATIGHLEHAGDRRVARQQVIDSTVHPKDSPRDEMPWPLRRRRVLVLRPASDC